MGMVGLILIVLLKERVVYKIHGGPMAGRTNFQTCVFQCLRAGELWQCNWLEGRDVFPLMRGFVCSRGCGDFVFFSFLRERKRESG